MRILSNGNQLINLSFQETDGPEDPDQITEWTKTQLSEYFTGTRTFFNIPLLLEGSEFESCVWNALQQIPYGTTISYKSLAKQIDRPNGMQAVGSANGRNPLAVIVPCHRVIGHNGDLKGYAGGIERKKWLLKHENSLLI